MFKICLVTNLIDGKVYVGQTCQTISARWNRHVYDSKKLDLRFSRAIRKYGPTNFDIREVATAETTDQINNLERLWITVLRANDPIYGYNSTIGGECLVGEANPFYGRKHSEESKQQMSVSKMGKYVRENSPNFGRIHSVETRQKMSEGKIGKPGPWLGKKRDIETNRKSAIAHTRQDIPMIEVEKLVADGMSMRDIAKKFNTCHQTISWRLLHRRDYE